MKNKLNPKQVEINKIDIGYTTGGKLIKLKIGSLGGKINKMNEHLAS